MKEFNYKRAWEELALPAFREAVKLPEFRAAWRETVKLSPLIQQTAKSTRRLRFIEPGDTDAAMSPPAPFDALAARVGAALPRLGALVNYFGYWATAPVCASTAGATWKFQIFTEQITGNAGELDSETKRFMDHKPGSGFDDEEQAGLVNAWLEESPVAGVRCVRVAGVNYQVKGYSGKGHPFVIGAEHFPRNGGMYIDVHQAGCAHCGYSHEDHTHETAAFLSGLAKLSKEELHAILLFLKERIASHNKQTPAEPVKVDGFALTDWKQ